MFWTDIHITAESDRINGLVKSGPDSDSVIHEAVTVEAFNLVRFFREQHLGPHHLEGVAPAFVLDLTGKAIERLRGCVCEPMIEVSEDRLVPVSSGGDQLVENTFKIATEVLAPPRTP